MADDEGGMTGIKAVFFDLDDTLIGYPRGFGGLVDDLYASAAGDAGDDVARERFGRAFMDATLGLWAAMHNGCLSGEELRRRRIVSALASLGIDDAGTADRLAAEWDARNIAVATIKPGARELLDRLAGRCYLGVITDSFRTIQRAKMQRLGLDRYFQAIHVSEEAGVCKPFAGIFEQALAQAGVAPGEAVMVGDNPNADIRGALGVGMHAIHLVNGTPGPSTPDGAIRAHGLVEVATLLCRIGGAD
ncbi:MAG: HAD family hydrolase [Anaerolineae bacterium]